MLWIPYLDGYLDTHIGKFNQAVLIGYMENTHRWGSFISFMQSVCFGLEYKDFENLIPC